MTTAASALPRTLVRANHDAALRKTFFAVYAELHDWLTDRDCRSVPAWRVAANVGVEKSTVYCALDMLERLGYLEQGALLGNARTYRLCLPEERAQRVA